MTEKPASEPQAKWRFGWERNDLVIRLTPTGNRFDINDVTRLLRDVDAWCKRPEKSGAE